MKNCRSYMRQKEMLSFLGLATYSRHFIPIYSEKSTPLRTMVNEQGMRDLTARLTWTTEGEKAFIALKQAFTTAAHLAVPDYKDTFFLDVSEGEHTANGVLFQKKGGNRKVLMYASIMLDPIENRQPPCVRHVAGVAKLLQKTAHLVMGYALTVLTTHSVVSLVSSAAFTMTSLRQTKMDKILTAPHITYTHEGINMAGFNTASGSPIKHEAEMRQLARALVEPAEVAVVKCKGHSKENSLEGKGNEAADQAATKAAGYKPSYSLLLVEKTVHEMLPRYDRERLSCDQEEASPHEKTDWKEKGGCES
ncbi:uncharacterized protein LOC130525994 [Takifugu flavidus]|uniref:uncharacterized protein LOC130525994 n=1 Tax=Takifugu flavidus TaxID=433684 RepID=UPI00254458EB|nr:uncharacterized protein LOC130525994 [Takifugu flavidus]